MNPFRLLKQPSAFLPVALSLAALATVMLHIVRFGTAPQADEGTSAHIWQLLMLLQLPLIAFFAISWLPRNPKQAALILTLQIAAAIGALAPIFLFNW